MINASNVHFGDNEKALKAISLIRDSNASVFLTGKAGTGKSTLLDYIIRHTQKSMVKLAPTGIAAININGQTIHRFFKFPVRPFLPNDKSLRFYAEIEQICNNVSTFIIDEVSMVRADLMTAIDLSLKKYMKNKLPFGGKQMLFVGDLFQLAPIVDNKKLEEAEIIKKNYNTPFFFSAPIFKIFDLTVIELNLVYRQSDITFVSILDRIRIGDVSQHDLDIINRQYSELKSPRRYNDKKMSLTCRTKQAELINSSILSSIDSPHVNFIATATGTFHGDIPKTKPPTYVNLTLCVGARVMLITNDKSNQWVNGTLGTITKINTKSISIEVLLDSNNYVEVTPHQWNDLAYYWNEENNRIDTKSVGTFDQLPVKLAWASTIHKAQGLTLEKVDINLGEGAFAEGQTYVALSRCNTLEGIELSQEIQLSDVKVSQEAIDFISAMRIIENFR